VVAIWQATRDGFSLDEKTLCGHLTTRGDTPGLRRVSSLVGAKRDSEASPILLAVRAVQVAHRPSFEVGAEKNTPESRIRGRLVDVQLEPTDRCPVRTHLYWKASASRLDLEVLASSSHPLQDLEVLTTSSHKAGEVLVRAANYGSGWVDVNDARALGTEWFVFPRDRVAAIMSLDGRCPPSDITSVAAPYRQPIVLYRPARQRWSYVEMSRPDDCVRIVVHIVPHRVTVSFGLFGLDVEKGVILRGRVRGMFLPRANDMRHCLRQFSRFAAESPRLSV
jgi:hypothetical protein